MILEEDILKRMRNLDSWILHKDSNPGTRQTEYTISFTLGFSPLEIRELERINLKALFAEVISDSDTRELEKEKQKSAKIKEGLETITKVLSRVRKEDLTKKEPEDILKLLVETLMETALTAK